MNTISTSSSAFGGKSLLALLLQPRTLRPRLMALLLLPLLLCGGGLRAQCPFAATFTTQAEVDAFLVDFPNCTAPFSLTIGPSTDIVDLSPLQNVEVPFSVTIENNAVLTTLDGLANLSSTISMTISSNPLLDDVDILGGTRNQGSFVFENNPLVTTLPVPDLMGEIFTFRISSNENLITITGPSSTFNYPPNAGNSMLITDNLKLTTITGFDMMEDLDGVPLRVANNASLQTCDIDLLCRQLDFGETPVVENNAPGCNSLEDVMGQCTDEVVLAVAFDLSTSGFTYDLDGNCMLNLPNFQDSFPVIDDDPAGVVYTQTPVAGTSYSGAQVVSVTVDVEDADGNTDEVTFMVNMVDVIPPTIQCVVDTIFAIALDGPGTINTADLFISASDNCAIAGTTNVGVLSFGCDDVIDLSAFPTIDFAPFTIIPDVVTVTDVNGLSTSCSLGIKVIDTVPPVLFFNPLDTAYLDAAGTVVYDAADAIIGSSDNCGTSEAFGQCPDAFDCDDVGQLFPLDVAAFDNLFNSDFQTMMLLVLDTIKPMAICQDIDVFVDNTGIASIAAPDNMTSMIDGGSMDNCSSVTFSEDITEFSCGDIGPNNVVLTVTDPSNKSSSCTAVVTVIDDIPPFADCEDINVYLDADGNASIATPDNMTSMIESASTENCESVTFSESKTEFDCAEVGSNMVILSVTDETGNVLDCQSTVTIIDTIKPMLTGCQPVSLTVEENSDITLTLADLTFVATDNCAVANTTATPLTFNCDTPDGQMITITTEDAAGKTGVCMVAVTVTCEMALPVDLLSFTGTVEGKTNALRWSVTNEEGLSHYELQRSGNGVGDWTTLEETSGAAAGAMEGLIDYVYTDEQPLSNAYYRLHAVDQDGTFTLSEVIQIERELTAGLKVFPNPSNGTFSLSLPLQEGEVATVQILDLSGREVLRQQATTTEIQLATSIAPGTYFLTATTASGKWVSKLVVR